MIEVNSGIPAHQVTRALEESSNNGARLRRWVGLRARVHQPSLRRLVRGEEDRSELYPARKADAQRLCGEL